MPIVRVPPPYRGPTQGAGEIEVDAANVLDCFEAVERKYPGFLPQVIDEDGNVHRFVKLFLNQQKLGADALRAKTAPGDELEVIAAIAGG